MTQQSLNPLLLRLDLEQRYRSYYDSTCSFADRSLMLERARLLESDPLSTDTIIEPLPGYRTSGERFEDLAARLGLGADVATFAGRIMAGNRLYTHQAEAIAAYEGGKHVVITAGTGSGKTEAFLLPIVTHLVRESRKWGAAGAQSRAWWKSGSHFEAQRLGETGRQPGMRGLVLYPMNALVEDQMIRMRRALDSDIQTAWLQAYRHGHRFYFGRYTGQTPSQGLNTILARYAERSHQAARRALAGADHRAYLPRPLGAEMLTRPDMIAYPPDILITNYSMLNVMLTRSDEASIFAQTAEYLQQPGAHFHLVVDELHSYKGTAGTEVALLLRRLLDRIGLTPNAAQLRIIAASASLGDADPRAYLEQFFGASQGKFVIVSGEPNLAGRGAPLAEDVVAQLTALGRRVLSSGAEPGGHLDDDDPGAGLLIARAVADACRDEAGDIVPTSSRTAGAALAPAESETDQQAALAGALHVASGQGSGTPLLPVRAHLFFRTLSGWWACTNRDCPEVPPELRSAQRTVGRLYAHPTIRCGCGSRCLDLWICQTCGEHLLGGYTSKPESTDEVSVRTQRQATNPTGTMELIETNVSAGGHLSGASLAHAPPSRHRLR